MSAANSNYSLFVARLQRLPARLYHGLRTALSRELEHIASRAQRKYLSGPRPAVLGTVSGRLRNSVVARVTQSTQEITGRVGTNVPYARRHEFGFKGVEQVRAHTRVVGFEVGGRAVTQKQIARLRREVKDQAGKRVGFRRSMKLIAGDLSGGAARVQFVRAHSRQVNYRGRPFLRPAIRDEYKKVAEAIRTAISNLKGQV